MEYTINQIAQLAEVTLRTLRYYDKIGLLIPLGRTFAGYRIYSDEDIEKLQQILFLRELDFPLQRIIEMLRDPTFDRKDALRMQAEYLEKKAERYLRLSQLAKDTLATLEGGMKMDKKELFNGFDYDKMMEEQKQYEAEVKERWGKTDAYRISKERVAKLTKADWERLNAEQGRNMQDLTELFQAGVSPEDLRVQEAVKKAHLFIHDTFYPCSLEMFSNLGSMYVADERFTAFYEKIATGLATFYNDAIQHYCITNA